MDKSNLDDEILDLLKDIIYNHRDPNSWDYNNCDGEPCMWCTRAMEVIKIKEKNMIVNIQGVGQFDVNEECLPKLLEFLTRNKSVRLSEDVTVKERIGGNFTGRELLSESI